ncbi:hypothetical protein ATG_06020 [Desulfurococcaceae archaeon AG1]|nr:hypothetical protein ATG_06020 [Desulfurococcaceae archaeon AG1]
MAVEERIKGEDKHMIDEIVSRMHGYVIRDEHIPWRFVDREAEVWNMVDEEGVVEGGWITVLYGPKGCGKSTFFRALSHAVDQIDAGLDILIVERAGDIQRSILHLPKSLRRLARDITDHVSKIIKISPDKTRALISPPTTYRISQNDSWIEFDASPFHIVNEISYYIAYWYEIDRRIVIVLDDARIDDEESLWRFRGWLENFANIIREDNSVYMDRGGSIAVIALTGDALVEEIRHIVGGKVNWALIWNLSRISSEELVSQMGLHHRVAGELGVGVETSKEILWRLAGGNPRALRLIWERGLKEWLVDEIIGGIRGFAQDLPEDQRGEALEKISERMDNVDDIAWTDPSIWKSMVKHNIIIYIAAAKKISEIPREPWIGREYAFQIPAYYHILKAMAKKRSWEISPEEVIREAMA